MKGLQTSTIIEIAIVAALGFAGGITQNFVVVVVGGLMSLCIAAPLYNKIEIERKTTTSFEKQSSAIAAFALVAVIFVVFYLIGGAITLF